MASTYTGLGIEKMTTGENAGTWGTKTNTNLQIVEQLAGGYIEKSIAGGAQTTTLSVSDGSTGAEFAHRILKFTGTITGNQVVTIPLDVQQMYILVNGTSGAYTVQFKYVSGSGSSLTFATTDKGTKIVYATADDGTNPNLVDTGISTNTITGVTGDITLDSPADIVIDAAGGNIEFKDAGTTQLTLDMDTTASVQILKLGVNSDDLVFQQYDGNEVIRIADDRRLYFYDKGGEYIYGDGTDLHIVSGADVNLSADIGLTFGDDGEKIEGDGTDLTITGNTINLTATTDVALAANTGLLMAGTEKLESDGTDLSITVGAGGDINIGTDIGLTFGNDGEKIEGDGTDLTITGNTINLTATTDVALAVNTGLLLAGTEKIESDGTDLSITVGASGDINIGTDIGLTFGNDGEKIEGDGTDLTITGNTINLTATTDVALAVNTGLLFAGTEKIESDGTDLSITVGGSGDINIGSDIGLTFGDDGEKIEGDGTDLTILSSGVLNLAAGGTTNQVKVTDGAFVPVADNDVDLGSNSLQWKDAYINGTLEADAITIGGSAIVSSPITALNNATANEIVTIGATTTELEAEGNFTYDGNNAALTSSTSTNPIVSLTNTNTDANGAILKFIKDAGEAGAANDVAGLISFYCDDAGQAQTEFARIQANVIDATAGGEEGSLDFHVAEYDGTLTKGMSITGLSSDTNITVDISTHDGSAGGLKLGGTLVTSTAAELNLVDGGTSRGTTAVADGDGILINDDGTMRMTTVQTVSTYMAAESVGGGNIVTTGALDSGSITSGFGAIDNGTSNIRSATITAETAFVPDASGGADLGTTALEFNDAFFNDSAVINFGDDQDTTLTHTDGTGLTLNSTNKLCFNDATQFVYGISGTVLGLGATDEIDLTATAIDINGTCDVSGTLTNASTAVNVAGTQTMWVPSNAMTPTTSNGCAAIAAVETTSGRPDMYVLDFDKDSDEHAQFAVAFPKSWNLGTVTFQAFWSGLAATGGVSWGLQGVAFADNDSINTVYGTAVVVDDTEQGAVEEVNVSAASGAVTIAGSPGDNELCYFRVFRDVSDSNDDSGGDARLHGIKLFYTTDAKNDA